MSTVDQLRKYLTGVGHGRLAEAEIREVECQLSGCWSDFQGSGDGGMTADKLVGRTGAMEWNRPTLTFKIERHGALMHGSSRAELQTWEINVIRGTTTLVAATGRRQIHAMAARLDVKPIAAEIAANINECREDKRIKWRGTNYVRIVVSDVIPATNKQTTAGRRRRFVVELERLLSPLGWHRKKPGSHLIFWRQSED